MTSPDVIVPFLFGLPTSLLGNLNIVKRAEELGKELNIPVSEIDVSERMSSTFKFVKALASVADRNGWKKILVVAAPDHAWRCVRDLKKLGFEAEADDYFSKNGILLYDKNSEQWWTRSRFLFWLREVPIFLLPFWLYDKIAG